MKRPQTEFDIDCPFRASGSSERVVYNMVYSLNAAGAPKGALRAGRLNSGLKPTTRSSSSRSRSTHTSATAPSSVDSPRIATNDPYVPPLNESTWQSFLKPYKSNYEELAFTVDPSMVTGTIPAELSGTLLRNGPGLFEIGGKKIPQPFDGDGKVAMFSFPRGGALPFFSTRFVRTKAFVDEQKAGRMLYRGAFSVGNPAGGWFYNPFDLRVKQIANTGVVRWAKKVLALYERGDLSLSLPAIRSVGYKQVWQHLSGESSYQEMVDRGIIATRQLAKRQVTWLRSWDGLHNLPGSTHDSLHKLLKIVVSATI